MAKPIAESYTFMKVIVVTREGGIYCFGGNATKAVVHAPPTETGVDPDARRGVRGQYHGKPAHARRAVDRAFIINSPILS